MRLLIAAVIALLTLGFAPTAAADTVKHPDENRVATFNVQTKALGPLPMETCLVREGADRFDIATHFDCLPVVTDEVTVHPVTVPEGEGHVRVFAVTRYIDPDGLTVVSALSDTRGKALDVPAKPELLAGAPAPVDDVG